MVVKHTVGKVLKAWNDSSFDAEAAIDEVSIPTKCDVTSPLINSLKILETFHHPYLVKPGSNLQEAMEASMKESINDLKRDNLIETLTKVIFLKRASVTTLTYIVAGKRPGKEECSNSTAT